MKKKYPWKAIVAVSVVAVTLGAFFLLLYQLRMNNMYGSPDVRPTDIKASKSWRKAVTLLPLSKLRG